MINVLFVCSSNVCRSPYCEYVFGRTVKNDEALAAIVGEVASGAVLNHSAQLHSKAYASLLKEGFTEEELKAHRPRHIRDYPEAKAIKRCPIPFSRAVRKSTTPRWR